MLKLQDIHSFELIFREHYASLCGRAWHFVQDKEQAEDIVQDVFCNLWNKRNEIVIYTSVEAYLHATTVNFALNYIKKKTAVQTRETSYFNAASTDNNSTEQLIQSKETAAAINTTLKKLPEACRAVFVLSRYENLSYKAIALQLNISIKTVESQMSKALKILRAEILAIAMCVLIFFSLG